MRSLQLLALVLLATAARADTFTWCGLEWQPSCALPGSFSYFDRVPTPEDTAGLHEAIVAAYGTALDPFHAGAEYVSRNGFVTVLVDGNMQWGDFIYRNGKLVCCFNDEWWITGINANDIAVGQDWGNGQPLELKLTDDGFVWFEDLSVWGVNPFDASILAIDDNNDIYGFSNGFAGLDGDKVVGNPGGYFVLLRDPVDPPRLVVNPEPSTNALLLTSLLLSMFLVRRGLRRRWLGTSWGRK